MTRKPIRAIVDFLADESGPTAVEYAVMVALITAVCIVSVAVLAGSLEDNLNSSGEALEVIN